MRSGKCPQCREAGCCLPGMAAAAGKAAIRRSRLLVIGGHGDAQRDAIHEELTLDLATQPGSAGQVTGTVRPGSHRSDGWAGCGPRSRVLGAKNKTKCMEKCAGVDEEAGEGKGWQRMEEAGFK